MTKDPISYNKRIGIALGILLVDFAVFFVPIGAVFLMYIVLSNPPWFREFLDRCK